MKYFGGKGGSGVYQRIISLMPPHRLYIEPFLGGGAILRMKRPAHQSIGIDLNGLVISSFPAMAAVTVLHGDGICWLRRMKIIIESTAKIVELNGVPARIWEGTTESGIPVHAFITRIAAPVTADLEQFERELQACRAPSLDVQAYPLRLLL